MDTTAALQAGTFLRTILEAGTYTDDAQLLSSLREVLDEVLDGDAAMAYQLDPSIIEAGQAFQQGLGYDVATDTPRYGTR